MGKIIMCGSFKGGVGKSVTTFNLAYSLAEIGKKALAVDFDSQANLTTCFGVEDVEALPVTIGHLMMDEIEEEALPETVEYIPRCVLNQRLTVINRLTNLHRCRNPAVKNPDLILEGLSHLFRNNLAEICP